MGRRPKNAFGGYFVALLHPSQKGRCGVPVLADSSWFVVGQHAHIGSREGSTVLEEAAGRRLPKLTHARAGGEQADRVCFGCMQMQLRPLAGHSFVDPFVGYCNSYGAGRLER